MQMNIVMVWVHANSLPTDLMWCAPILVTHVYLSWSVPYSFVTGPEIQIPHQPGSPEYTLHRSISEKFTIRRLFACLNANSSNMVPEPSLVMEPISNDDVTACLGISPNTISSNTVPEPFLTVQPATNDAATG